MGTSLAVQGLGFSAFTAEGAGSVPGWGSKILQAAVQEKKKRMTCWGARMLSWTHEHHLILFRFIQRTIVVFQYFKYIFFMLFITKKSIYTKYPFLKKKKIQILEQEFYAE